MRELIKRSVSTLRRVPTRILGVASQVAHTKLALYVMLAAALINAYALLLENDLCAMLVFLASGLAISLRTKNMTIVLFAAILGANLLKFARKMTQREGFEDDPDEETNVEEGVEVPGATDDSDDSGEKKDKTENFEDMYAELMKLQTDIIEGVKRVHEPLAKVESIVNELKESMATA